MRSGVMVLSLLGLVMILAGCATLMVSPDGQHVVNCGRMSQTPEGVYWSVNTFGISSAVSNSQCATQFRGAGWIPMDEWRERASQAQAQQTEVRRYWQDGLRPQVVNGTMTAQEAVERLIAKERTLFPENVQTDQLFTIRRMLAEAVDAGTLSLTQAELMETEFRKTGRLPEGVRLDSQRPRTWLLSR